MLAITASHACRNGEGHPHKCQVINYSLCLLVGPKINSKSKGTDSDVQKNKIRGRYPPGVIIIIIILSFNTCKISASSILLVSDNNYKRVKTDESSC